MIKLFSTTIKWQNVKTKYGEIFFIAKVNVLFIHVLIWMTPCTEIPTEGKNAYRDKIQLGAKLMRHR